jgi:hypothetical protein
MSTPQFAPPAGSEVATPATSNRVPRCFALRTAVCASDGFIPAPPQIDNGDEARYADKCGTYAKCILQGTIGRVDVAAYRSFKKALNSGKPADFANIVLGGPRTLNGPQGGVAFDLEGLDSAQFAVPPAPTLASELYATELVELYWASLLRDIAFTIGPYLSQFLLQNTSMGALPVVQQYDTLLSGVDFMKDPVTFQQVQNGISTGLAITLGAPLFMHNGRGLASFTHVDVLYQAYFTAYLVLNTINGLEALM